MATRDYLVIDLEATCDDQGAVPRDEMEIIEVGAVWVDGRTMQGVDEFQTFIRPARHPVLTAFCRELTSITQAQVDSAPGFRAAMSALSGFIEVQRGGGPPPVWGSWGAYDRRQFEQDARWHRVELPLPRAHVNIKERFSQALGTKKRFGMARALHRVGIELEGTHHRGIDDARNIAKLLPFALGVAGVPEPPRGWRRAGKRRGPMT